MRKHFLIVVILCIFALLLVSCGGTSTDTDTQKENVNTNTDTNTDTQPSLKDFEGIEFDDLTVDYNGQEHKIEVVGTLPQGATVSYTNNVGTDANTYNAEAVISCEGYNTLTLKAKLTVNKIDITGITFTGNTWDYDATEHKIEIEGTLPNGVTLSYSGGENKNSSTNAGNYEVVATMTGKNYNTLTLKANLVINKLTLPQNSIIFEGASFEYDAKEHSISVTGNIPNGVTVEYSGGQNGKNGSTAGGSYEITAKISGKNYNELVLKATLTIKSTEELLNVHFHNGNVYFQNSLDKNTLYTYDGNALTKVNKDIPTNMVTVGTNMFYVSQNLLSKSISTLDSTGKVTDLFDVDAETIATDGTYI
ncbi:MAG: hypothetical protein IKA02_04200 [Clostridia bacterium]|nr:hypothetical protein [Clostridia bacterium]